jgi:hypothetical protein
VKPNLNFGSLTFAWLVSWVGPPMTGSSFDNSPLFLSDTARAWLEDLPP